MNQELKMIIDGILADPEYKGEMPRVKFRIDRTILRDLLSKTTASFDSKGEPIWDKEAVLKVIEYMLCFAEFLGALGYKHAQDGGGETVKELTALHRQAARLWLAYDAHEDALQSTRLVELVKNEI
jgi:hypothetical protein